MRKPGGKRCGAGRKPAPYKTVIISFRVREECAAEIKEIVKTKIEEKNNELRDKRK